LKNSDRFPIFLKPRKEYARIDDQYGISCEGTTMKRQRGFVGIEGPAARAASPAGQHPRTRSRFSPLAALRRARAFAAGLLIGIGIWTPVFAALNDQPGAWAAAGSLVLFGFAGAISRRGG
jgi:hypothetical protein